MPACHARGYPQLLVIKTACIDCRPFLSRCYPRTHIVVLLLLKQDFQKAITYRRLFVPLRLTKQGKVYFSDDDLLLGSFPAIIREMCVWFSTCSSQILRWLAPLQTHGLLFRGIYQYQVWHQVLHQVWQGCSFWGRGSRKKLSHIITAEHTFHHTIDIRFNFFPDQLFNASLENWLWKEKVLVPLKHCLHILSSRGQNRSITPARSFHVI